MSLLRPRDLVSSTLVLVLAATAACGGAPGSDADAGAPASGASTTTARQACDLLSASDVTAVIGEPVEAGEPLGHECTFRRPADADGFRARAARVRLEYGTATPAELLDQYRANMREGLGGAYDPPAEPGVGDVAVWDGHQLVAAAAAGPGRSASVLVQLIDVDAAQEHAWAHALAVQAIARAR